MAGVDRVQERVVNAERHDGEHRAEGLLGHDRHRGGAARQHRGHEGGEPLVNVLDELSAEAERGALGARGKERDLK